MAEKVMINNVLKGIKNHTKMILSTTFLSVGLLWILFIFLSAPSYQATSQLYINPVIGNEPAISEKENMPFHSEVEDYSNMIKSKEILAKAITAIGSSSTPNELYEKVSVSNVQSSRVLNISVEEKNGTLALEMADALAETAVNESQNLGEGSGLVVIAKASVQKNPSISEKKAYYILFTGGIFGTIAGVLLPVIVKLFHLQFRIRVLEKRRKSSNLQTVFK